MNRAFDRSRGMRWYAAGVFAAVALTVTGCAQDDDGRQPSVDSVPAGQGGEESGNVSGDRPNPTVASTPSPKRVDASTLKDGRLEGQYSFSTDSGRICVFDEEGALCAGKAPADAPAIPPFSEPNGASVHSEGVRYAIFEGFDVDPGRLEVGEYVELGQVRCSHDDADTVSCSIGDNGFTLNGPDGLINLEGTVIDDSPGGGSDSDSSGSSDSSGYITSVSTSSGRARASSPSCDSRGILIVESVVEEPGVSTGQAIADALDTYPGSEFTTPGVCPSLRSQLDGADIYAVYVDYGDDTDGLCSAAARTGGNARVLSDDDEYVSPC